MTDPKKQDEVKKSALVNMKELCIGASKKVSDLVRNKAETITSTFDTRLTRLYSKINGPEQKQEQGKKLKK